MSNKVVKCKNCGEDFSSTTAINHSFIAISTKFLVVLVVSIMCVAFTSCGKPSEVQLTKENIKDYLSFEFSMIIFSNFSGVYFFEHDDIINKNKNNITKQPNTINIIFFNFSSI